MVETKNEQQVFCGNILTDKAGSKIPQIAGMGVSGSSEFMEVPLPPGLNMQVLSFDASSVQGEPAELELQFSIQLRERVFPQLSAPEESASPESGELEMALLEDIGEYNFDFTVPFLAAERLNVQQTIELESVSIQLCPHGSIRCTSGDPINNLSVQLEQISITPSEMQAKLCVNLPAEWRQDWFFAASVESESGQKMPQAGSRPGERCKRVRFLGRLTDRPAHIRLEVNEIIVWEEQLNQRRLQGPWRFQFEIP